MTVKQEAEELYNKFHFEIPSYPDEGQQEHQAAKKCALIAVNVILSRCIDEEEQYRAYKYWEEVKQEIEKL
jgi:hypothetical protein